MGPVAAVIATFAVTVGRAIATAYGASVLVRAAVQIAAVFALQALIGKPQAGKINQGQELSLKLDPTMPRQIPVGQTATGGSLVWAFTWTDQTSKPNKYLVRIIEISDYPINSVLKIWEGKDELTFESSIYTSGDPVPCVQHRKKNGDPAMWLQVIKGSFAATAISWLTTASAGLWTSNHKGTGLAYAVAQYEFDADAYPNGEPGLVLEVEGAACYDDRYDGSKPDRTGDQRLDDPNTWAYTRNSAIITAQALRGWYINGKKIIGSGADSNDLKDSMLLSAYNVCDVTVTNADDSTEPQYRAGMLLSSAETVATYLADLQLAFDGGVYDRGGEITILPGAARTPVMHLTDDDIIWTEEKSFQPKSSLDTLYNSVAGSFVDSSAHYTEKPFPILKNSTWEDDDGSERITRDISFRAVTVNTQVQRTTARIFKDSRNQLIIAFVGPLWLLELEQGDWFTLTSVRWGLDNVTFQVEVPTITADLRYSIVATEVSADSYVYNAVEEQVPDTTDTYTPPADTIPVPTFTLEAVQAVSDDTTYTSPGIKFTLTNPSNNTVFIEVRKVGDTALTVTATLEAEATVITIVGGIVPMTDYEVRAQNRSGLRSGDWSAWSAPITTLDFVYEPTVNWGDIGGTLSSQTDLDTALSGKIPTSYLDTDVTLAANSDVKLATQKATKAYVDSRLAAADAVIFKGTVDCSTNPNYPAADAGHLYMVSVAGKIGGASGKTVTAGDLFICLVDSTASGNQATVGANWDVLHTTVSGALSPSDIGATVQAWSAILDQIATLTGASNDDILQKKAGSWVNRTIAQLAADLGISNTYKVVPTYRPSGRYHHPLTKTPAATTGAVAADTLYLLPFLKPEQSIDALIVECTATGTATAFRIGIYTQSSDGLTWTLMHTATPAALTAAVLVNTLASPQTIKSGFWVGIHFDGTCTMRLADDDSAGIKNVMGGTDLTSAASAGLTKAAIYASGLPASFTTPSVAGTPPMMATRTV